MSNKIIKKTAISLAAVGVAGSVATISQNVKADTVLPAQTQTEETINNDLANKKQELSNAQNTANDAQAKLNSAKENAKDAQTKLSDSQNKVNNAQKDVSDVQKLAQDATDTNIKNTQDEIAKHNSELNSANADIKNAQNAVNDAKANSNLAQNMQIAHKKRLMPLSKIYLIKKKPKMMLKMTMIHLRALTPKTL